MLTSLILLQQFVPQPDRGNPWNSKINDPLLRNFLFDQSRSHGLFIDLDDARLTLKFAAPIRKIFGAKGM